MGPRGTRQARVLLTELCLCVCGTLFLLLPHGAAASWHARIVGTTLAMGCSRVEQSSSASIDRAIFRDHGQQGGSKTGQAMAARPEIGPGGTF